MPKSESEKLTQQLKKIAFSNKVDLIGIADPKVFDDMPATDRPRDILDDSKAVVVYAVKYRNSDCLFDEKWWIQLEKRLTRIDKKLADFLIKRGYVAHSFRVEGNAHICYDEINEMAIPFEDREKAPTYQQREKLLKPLDKRRKLYCRIQFAAVAAGLGGFNKNRMVIIPSYGPFFHLSMIITDAPLELDKPFDQDLCGDCNLCIEACPKGARTGGGLADASKCNPIECRFNCLRICNEKFAGRRKT